MTSVNNGPRSVPDYDIPSMAPNLYTQMPVLIPATMIGANKHLVPIGKTNQCLSNDDTPGLTSPPSYASVTGKRETQTKPEPTTYRTTSSGEMVDRGTSEAETEDSTLLQ